MKKRLRPCSSILLCLDLNPFTTGLPQKQDYWGFDHRIMSSSILEPNLFRSLQVSGFRRLENFSLLPESLPNRSLLHLRKKGLPKEVVEKILASQSDLLVRLEDLVRGGDLQRLAHSWSLTSQGRLMSNQGL